MTDLEFESLKIILKSVIIPNVESLYNVNITDYEDKQIKYILCPDLDASKKRHLAIVLNSVVAGTHGDWRLSAHIAKKHGLEHRWMVDVRTFKQLTNSRYEQGFVAQAVFEAKKNEGYAKLIEQYKVDDLVAKTLEQRNKQRAYAEKKRAVVFTLQDQTEISRVLLSLVIKKTDNYLLKIMSEKIMAADVDKSGQALADALEIYSLDREEIVKTLLSSQSTTARRFAALFAKEATVALIDKDKTVRLAAKARQVTRMEIKK